MPDPMSEADVMGLADVAFGAKVVTLGDPPGAVCGRSIVCQPVTVEVTELRSGSGLQVGDRVELAIPVVASARDVAPQPNGGMGLDTSLYRPGAPFVAFAKWVNDRWTALAIDIDLDLKRLAPEPAPALYAGKNRSRSSFDRKSAGL